MLKILSGIAYLVKPMRNIYSISLHSAIRQRSSQIHIGAIVIMKQTCSS